MNKHISEQYDVELEQLRNALMEMGGLVESQIEQACRALIAHDIELAEQTRALDRRVNQLEVEIDEQVVQIIALRQPTASDLRTLICIMKASTDLERIGDESDRIAKMALGMARLVRPEDQYKRIRSLGQKTRRMVTDALDAFARSDADSARGVIAADREVDTEYRLTIDELKAELVRHPKDSERAVNTMWVARALERIGDHAKNIGELVVFQVQGLDVRHPPKES